MTNEEEESILQKMVRLEKENDFMRVRLAESDFDCVYCKLPKSDMVKCADGFPGCARADDLMICDELARRDERMRDEGILEFMQGFLQQFEEGDPFRKTEVFGRLVSQVAEMRKAARCL